MMLTIFVNIISHLYSRSANQVHRWSVFFIYIYNIDPYPNSKSMSLRPKFRFQIHFCFTISFLSLVIFTNMISSMNLRTEFIIIQEEYRCGTPTCHQCSICVPLLLLLYSLCGFSWIHKYTTLVHDWFPFRK